MIAHLMKISFFSFVFVELIQYGNELTSYKILGIYDVAARGRCESLCTLICWLHYSIFLVSQLIVVCWQMNIHTMLKHSVPAYTFFGTKLVASRLFYFIYI